MSSQLQLTDEDLVTKCRVGESWAANELVKKYHVAFCERANYLLADLDLAKDIAQKSWMVIFDRLDELKSPQNFKHWAFRIVYTKSIDALRKRNRMRTQQLEYAVQNEADSLMDAETDGIDPLKQKLLGAIKELSVPHQLIIRLFYTEDYSIKELAQLLSISEGTVKSRLFHARERLKKQLNSFKKF